MNEVSITDRSGITLTTSELYVPFRRHEQADSNDNAFDQKQKHTRLLLPVMTASRQCRTGSRQSEKSQARFKQIISMLALFWALVQCSFLGRCHTVSVPRIRTAYIRDAGEAHYLHSNTFGLHGTSILHQISLRTSQSLPIPTINKTRSESRWISVTTFLVGPCLFFLFIPSSRDVLKKTVIS
jgi:hypothetical protein